MPNKKLSLEEVDRVLLNRMNIKKYNQELEKNSKCTLLVDIEETCLNEFGKIKNTLRDIGGNINRLDSLAFKDFIYNRSTSLQEALAYATRFYIPIEVYFNAMDFFKEFSNLGKGDQKKEISKWCDSLDCNIILELQSKIEKEVIPSEIERVKSSFKIYYLDHIAISICSKLLDMTIQELCSRIIKNYIQDVNYENAKEVILTQNRNMNRSLDLYRGGLNYDNK